MLESALAGSDSWSGIHLDWFGGMSAKIERQLEDLPHVTVHGRVPREVLHQTLARADVFVLSSYQEGCPMALLEAMSFGVVPISSDGIDAMRWLVTHGRNGFICQLDDFAKQMLECLAYLLAHPQALVAMKRATRDTYLDGLRSDQLAERLLDLLRQPTVDRTRPQRRIRILRWHRPMSYESQRSPLLDRICIRLGILRKAGFLDRPEHASKEGQSG